MSNLIEHAKKELEIAGLFDESGDFYGGMTGKAVMELVEVFSKQGHSGMSAPQVIKIFSKVANFEPLNAITGNDDEWHEYKEGGYQNIRLSSIFKEGKDGVPYYLDAIVWREKSGSCFTGKVGEITSRQNIKFPFLPKTFYINVDEERNILEPEKLTEAIEHFKK